MDKRNHYSNRRYETPFVANEGPEMIYNLTNVGLHDLSYRVIKKAEIIRMFNLTILMTNKAVTI